jgi:hypothetical protein
MTPLLSSVAGSIVASGRLRLSCWRGRNAEMVESAKAPGPAKRRRAKLHLSQVYEFPLNLPSTMIWHHIVMLRGEAARLSGTDMPDDHYPLILRRNPEDIDLGAIKADLEFLIEVARGSARSKPSSRSTR